MVHVVEDLSESPRVARGAHGLGDHELSLVAGDLLVIIEILVHEVHVHVDGVNVGTLNRLGADAVLLARDHVIDVCVAQREESLVVFCGSLGPVKFTRCNSQTCDASQRK